MNDNPTIRQARLKISAQTARALQAGLYPNPMLRYTGEQIGTDVPGDTDSPGEFQGMTLQQRFVTGGKLRLSGQDRVDWIFRCHMIHHIMNPMVRQVGPRIRDGTSVDRYLADIGFRPRKVRFSRRSFDASATLNATSRQRAVDQPVRGSPFPRPVNGCD